MLLLDTHVVVWLLGIPEKLSKNAAAAITLARSQGQSLSIAAITLFELASLAARQRIQLQFSVESFLEEVEKRFRVIPLDRHIAVHCGKLPPVYPSDPMDRIIGATAIVEGLTLITADERFRKSGSVKTLW